MATPANGDLVFSCLEDGPWQLVAPDGTIKGDVAGTPLDPNAPGCFNMGRQTNNRIYIAAESFLFTTDPDLTNPNPNPADYDDANCSSTSGLCFGGAPYQFDQFSGGTSGTLLYIFTFILPDVFTTYLIEIDSTTWTRTRTWPVAQNYGFPTIATDSAHTVAFYNDQTASTVIRLDLGTGVESTFLTSVHAEGVLMLPDDTLVVGCTTGGVKRYALDGTLLNTYSHNSSSSSQQSLALGTTANNSIWLMDQAISGGYVHLWEVEVDSGAILNEFELPNNGKSWNNPYAVVQLTEPPEETGTIIVVKVTNPPSDPQVFSFTTTNLTPSTFTLIDGDTQTFADVPSGDGYGVSEDVVANWGTEYTVSNDSPIDNISVGSGETVTITVTNTFAGDCIETVYGVRVLRRAPHISTEQLLRMHKRFTLDVEAGLGLRTDPAIAVIILLRWSDDGGHTWSAYYELSAGSIGQYAKRVFRNRLGKSRDRIYECSSTDDAFQNWLAVYLDTELASR